MTTSKTPDTIKVEVIAGNGIRAGSIDAFTTIQITNDITMPSEASFELGDDGTFNALGDIFQPGVAFQVFVNDRPRLRGRVEMLDSPFDTGAGAVTRFTVRTKLSDAMVASADQGIKVKGTSLKEFILKLYEPLGFFEDKFEFDQTAAVNLITGKAKGDRDRPLDLERIKVKEARVRPPETIYAAADKHLRRHGLMHWDSPNGKIVVGLPNDTQSPSFKLNMFKDSRSDGNNILSGTRTRDWSGVPSSVNVFGRGGKRGFTSKSIGFTANNLDVTRANFYRPVHIISEGIRTAELAERTANRELSARSKRKDAFNITVDGFSYWEGGQPALYAPDTVVQIATDVAGGQGGSYYLSATTFTRSAREGDTTTLALLQKGIWRL